MVLSEPFESVKMSEAGAGLMILFKIPLLACALGLNAKRAKIGSLVYKANERFVITVVDMC